MSETGRAAETPSTAIQSARADRELAVSRVVDAPRELVFEAFTEVRHLSRWWGPDGFTTTRAFEAVLAFEAGGATTKITMTTVFPTKEHRDEAVEKYHAIEGGLQTLGNLAAYVSENVRKVMGPDAKYG